MIVAPRTGRLLVVYLSETVDISPGSCVGGFGLALSSFLLWIAVLLRHAVVAETPGGGAFSRSNRWAFIVGTLACAGALGVSAFEYRNNWQGDVHLMFAATFFIGATLWVLIHTWVDAKLGILPPVRGGTLAGALRAFYPGATCVLLAFTLATSSRSNGGISRDARTTWNEIEAGVEISLFLTIMGYFSLQMGPFRRLRFGLGVSLEGGAHEEPETINDGTAAAHQPLLI